MLRAPLSAGELQEINDLFVTRKLSPKKSQGLLQDYESALSARFGGTAIALNNGTAAIFAALSLLDLAPDDEIIYPCYGWHACVAPLRLLAGKVRYCPVRADDLTLDVAELAALITPRTKAIFCLHLYGNPCDMRALRALADQHGLKLIEDCSHAYGGHVDGKPLGQYGDFACYSTQQSKLLSTGEGGFLIVHNSADAQRVYERFLPGRDDRHESWLKFRPHGLAVWLGLRDLSTLTERVAHVRAQYEVLRQEVRSTDRVRLVEHAERFHGRSFFEARLLLDEAVDRGELLSRLRTDWFEGDEYHYLPEKFPGEATSGAEMRRLLSRVINFRLPEAPDALGISERMQALLEALDG